MHLLTDGGLAVRNGGFIIYVRCDPGEGDDLSARFEEDGTGSTLPERVRHRARFTIAHELAHTLFYDLRSLPPELKFEINAAAETRLELACNEIAGALLLPRRLLQQRTSTVRDMDPRELRKLAEQNASVSSNAGAAFRTDGSVPTSGGNPRKHRICRT